MGDQPACPLGTCDGSGWILGPEDIARPCECREKRTARRRSRGVASAIPPRYRGVSFDRPPVSDMLRDPAHAAVAKRVEEFALDIKARLDEGRGLWLVGDVGTGKTTLAMLVSKAAIEAGRTVAIYSLPKLLYRIRRTYESDYGEDSFLGFFERLTAVDLLHLDDLGAEKISDWVIEQLYSIVNERYENERSIIVTMNTAADEDGDEGGALQFGPSPASRLPKGFMDVLEERIGERTVSRLVEICGEPLPLHGPDLRYASSGDR